MQIGKKKNKSLTTSFLKPEFVCACVATGFVACCASQFSQGPVPSGGRTTPRVHVFKNPGLKSPGCGSCLSLPVFPPLPAGSEIAWAAWS